MGINFGTGIPLGDLLITCCMVATDALPAPVKGTLSKQAIIISAAAIFFNNSQLNDLPEPPLLSVAVSNKKQSTAFLYSFNISKSKSLFKPKALITKEYFFNFISYFFCGFIQ